MPEHSDAYLAYFAGLTDLNARWTTFATTAGTELPNVVINSPDLELITWLSNETGVNVIHRQRKYNKHTCKEHCELAHQHVTTSSYRWSLGGAKATILAYNLLPYTLRQAEAVAHARDVGLEAPIKPISLAKMRTLGWRIPPVWAGLVAA